MPPESDPRLRVHMLQAVEPVAQVGSLNEALEPHGGVVLTAGPAEQDARYRVLIGGRPSREDLERSSELELLLIPYAGLPPETRTLLADFPELRVHNLHHNAVATAEGAVGLLLAAARHTVVADREFRRGDWRIRYESPSRSQVLAGKTALVLGYGAIGRRVARLLQAFDMEVCAVRRTPAAEDPSWVHPLAKLDALLPSAQVVVACLPGTEATRGTLDARRLGLLPQGAIAVNVGRGSVIDEEALYTSLRDGHLGGAGIDVWYAYPKDEAARAETAPSEFPFHELETVVMSPHRTAHGDVNEGLRWAAIAAFLVDFVQGKPLPHAVDLDQGY